MLCTKPTFNFLLALGESILFTLHMRCDTTNKENFPTYQTFMFLAQSTFNVNRLLPLEKLNNDTHLQIIPTYNNQHQLYFPSYNYA